MVNLHGFNRLERIEIPGAARFLTFSCLHRTRSFLSSFACQIAATELTEIVARDENEMHAWCIMPDHMHLLITTKKATVTDFLRDFKSKVSLLISPDNPRGIWERGGGHDRTIYSCAEFREKLRYTHLNPIRAGLVQQDRDWAWTSWHECHGSPRSDMPRITAMNADRLVDACAEWQRRQMRFLNR